MLHELLVCLLGKPGSLIISQPDRFYIDPSLTFLSQSEKTLLNKIVMLGYYFKTIQNFLDDIQNCQTYNFQPDIKEKYVKKVNLTYTGDSTQIIRDRGTTTKNENESFLSRLESGNKEPINIFSEKKNDNKNSEQNNILQNAYNNEIRPQISEEIWEFDSLYLKALGEGVEELIQEYREKILEVERDYLKNHVYTVCMLNVTFAKYFELFPEIINLVKFEKI